MVAAAVAGIAVVPTQRNGARGWFCRGSAHLASLDTPFQWLSHLGLQVRGPMSTAIPFLWSESATWQRGQPMILCGLPGSGPAYPSLIEIAKCAAR